MIYVNKHTTCNERLVNVSFFCLFVAFILMFVCMFSVYILYINLSWNFKQKNVHSKF